MRSLEGLDAFDKGLRVVAREVGGDGVLFGFLSGRMCVCECVCRALKPELEEKEEGQDGRKSTTTTTAPAAGESKISQAASLPPCWLGLLGFARRVQDAFRSD